MLRIILIVLIVLAAIFCCYGVVSIQPTLPTEILSIQDGGQVETPAAEGATPTLTPTPTPTRVSPKVLLEEFSSGPPIVIQDGRAYLATEEGGFDLETGQPVQTEFLPRHGLLIALVMPLFCFGIPWLILELFIIRHVQPRGIDLSTVLIKARDGLFVQAVVSMTARRTLTLAASRMTWSRVQNFVEKPIEQELIHEAISYDVLEELEQNLKTITEKLLQLPIIEELYESYGVEVIRFNIEIRYTSETREALRRKAEASAGGTAYLAYAAAAHLDPDRPESRELYRIYQETSSQVDAYRNLGGGIGALAAILRQQELESNPDDGDSDE